MRFVRKTHKMEFLSPLLGFQTDFQAVEYRQDPLTGHHSRINVGRAGRAKQAQGNVSGASEVAAATRQGCFFCPESIELKTPTFPQRIFTQGRVRRGECQLFPNLFPLAAHHMVATMTEQHFLELNQFTPRMIADNLAASREVLLHLQHHHNDAQYPMWMWNHLPPSAASIVHPHTQLLLDQEPMAESRLILQRSKEYMSRHGSNYWGDLAREEKLRGERYIADTGSLVVLASFAPRGNRELVILFRETSNLGDLTDAQIQLFSQVVVKLLDAYHRLGVDSFNLMTYSAAVGEKAGSFWLNARLISRPAFQPFYSTDAGPMERFFNERVIEMWPEDIAAEVRPSLAGLLLPGPTFPRNL